jgi:hypothetical protein
MKAKLHSVLIWTCALTLVLAGSLAEAGSPKGAKAIFDSGEGPAAGMSVVGTPAAEAAKPKAAAAAPASAQKYVGISYELMLLTDDGQIRKVPNNRTFKSGERLVMRVMTNRSGYLKIYNIGPTGNVNILAEGMVDAYSMTQIPRNSAMRFVGDPGVETILIMLGDDSAAPGAIGGPGATTAQAVPPPPPNIGMAAAPGGPASPPPFPAPGSSPSVASLPPPPPLMIASNIEGAKSIKGAKDIVAEDSMKSSFAVVSPQNQWAPVRSGTKDLVLESSQGVNYGVIPAAAVSSGGILSLTVKLRHN